MDVLGLLWQVDQALATLSRRMLHTLGVTSPQRVALRAVALQPAISAAGLATVLRVDPSGVTGILRRLENAGLVVRSTDTADGRRNRIHLTDEGRRIDGLRRGTVEVAMARTLLAFSAGEVATVARFLAGFTAELEAEREVLDGGRGDPA